MDGFPFDAYPELWYLGTLAVDPTQQRRGIGRQLIEWGLQRARQEQVSAGLEASAKGIGLYESPGFRTVNTIELMPGLTIQAMLWEPPVSHRTDQVLEETGALHEEVEEVLPINLNTVSWCSSQGMPGKYYEH